MARDDFSAKVIDVLAKRVGWHCSNPACGRPTVGPHSEPAAFVNLGVAAHIIAASPGGPRADTSYSPERRKDISNGIWLCQDCAKLIDSDEARYTPELLRQWKSDKEAEIEEHVTRGTVPDVKGPPLAVSQPMRLGSIGYVRLQDGATIPVVDILDSNEDPTQYFAAFAFRLVLRPVQAVRPTILHGVGIDVLKVDPIPPYRIMMGVYPVSFNLYVLPFNDPAKAGTTRFMAAKRYEVRSGSHSEEQPYQPLRLEPDAPEVFDLRLQASSPGLFTLRLFAAVSVGTTVVEQDLIPSVQVLVPEPEIMDGDIDPPNHRPP